MLTISEATFLIIYCFDIPLCVKPWPAWKDWRLIWGAKNITFLEKQAKNKKKDSFLLTLEKSTNCINLLNYCFGLIISNLVFFHPIVAFVSVAFTSPQWRVKLFSFESLFIQLREWSCSYTCSSHGAVEVTSKVYCSSSSISIRNGTKNV